MDIIDTPTHPNALAEDNIIGGWALGFRLIDILIFPIDFLTYSTITVYSESPVLCIMPTV